jgi:hypothetical protein
MKFKYLAVCALSLAMASPALAQSGPDDLHCFALSNFFAKAAKEPRGKAMASEASLFYLGRLDGHLDARATAALANIRFDPKTSGAQMTACAQRVALVEQQLNKTMRAIAGPAPAVKH